MKPTEALLQIEAALNAAIQKGAFANLEAATYIFNCLQVIKNELTKPAPTSQDSDQKN